MLGLGYLGQFPGRVRVSVKSQIGLGLGYLGQIPGRVSFSVKSPIGLGLVSNPR